MDDYENDGRDYNENIDEGYPTDIETEGFFTRKTEVVDPKTQDPEKNSTEQKKCRSCECKDVKKRKKRQSGRKEISRTEDTSNSKGKSDKKPEILKKQGRKGRKKKERRLSNPFILFYLEMFRKNPKRCVAETAAEAGRAWSKMSAKEKEAYINKAKQARARRQQQTATTKKKRGRASKATREKPMGC